MRTLAAALGLALATAVAASQEETWQAITDRAERAFWWGDFAELQRMHERYNRRDERVPSGRPKLIAMEAGRDRVLNHRIKDRRAYLAELEALTLLWTREHPQSSLAHALHADVLVEIAWLYRGGGYASTVSPQGWEDFKLYIGRAADHLMRHADAALTTSEGHATLLTVGRAASWNVDRLWAIAQAGLKLNPQDDRLYEGVVHALLPKWGGSSVSLDRFINDAVGRARAERGMELYARLYHYAASNQYGGGLFTESGAEWAKMKQGFDDILARYPDPVNVNRYAYYACLAQDKPTTISLLERVGAKPLLDEWSSEGAAGFDSCKRWAARQ